MADFIVKPSVALAARARAHECQGDDPSTRPLRVFAVDPSLPKAEGCVATVHVPYEPLEAGPVGNLFEVECADGRIRFPSLDLDNPRILINNGLPPSVPNPAFHQQMVYAISSSVYATFRRALGRLIAWGGDDTMQHPAAGHLRLRLRPHVAQEGANATYDRNLREIRFGYSTDPRLPDSRVFACLSHDIIAHEMTHALIDGLRSHLTIPTNGDVLGFHEGLADLVAVFHHFLYPEVLAAQIREVGPKVEHSAMLTEIAANFGLSTGGQGAVRRVGTDGKLQYDGNLEAHQIGNVLASAVFTAFAKVFRRKTAKYIRLAGPQLDGYWREELVQIMADEAAELARSFLNICIRALDYCPPVDIQLGEYLRAMITADSNLVAEDKWSYRETLIRSFAAHGIFPHGVMHMSEDAILWCKPSRVMPRVAELSFNLLRFNGDPASPASAEELNHQARALGTFITQPAFCSEFGLTSASVSRGVDPPEIASVRTSRRVGPDGQVLFDLIAEVTQRRTVTHAVSGIRTKILGGSTIVVGPKGEIRFAISKNVLSEGRLSAQLDFQSTSEFWQSESGQYRLRGPVLPSVHDGLNRLHGAGCCA